MTSGTRQSSHVGVKCLGGACFTLFAFAAWQTPQVPWGVWGPTLPPQLAIKWGAIAGELAWQEPWRLISAVFLHVSVVQLLVTLFALKSPGEAVEERCGWLKMLLLFLVSTTLGFAVSRFWYGPFGPVTVGASGGAFGFIGFDVGTRLRKRESLVSEPMIHLAVTSLLLIFLVPLNNPLHLGGGIAGLLLGLLRRRRAAQGNAAP